MSVSDQGMIAITLNYLCDSEDEAIFGVPINYRGLIRRGHNGGTWDPDDEKWKVNVTYQGLADGASPSEDLDTFNIDGEFREEPIESFPNRQLLVANYGAYYEEGRIKFPETLSGTKAATGLSSARAAEKNPFFGVTSYPVYYEVASHTYVRPSVPARVHRERGTVLDRLPSGFDYQGNSKSWFVDAPSLKKIGNCWSITERYKDLDDLVHLNALMRLVKK